MIKTQKQMRLDAREERIIEQKMNALGDKVNDLVEEWAIIFCLFFVAIICVWGV